MTGSAQALARAARIAGLSYVLIIALGIAQGVFVASALVIPADPASTASNIAAHELLFRLGIFSDTTLYTLVLVLSVSLFLVLEGVDRPLALAALVLRCAEGLVGLVVTLLGGLMPLLLLAGPTGSDPGELQLLAVSFLELRTAGLDIILILIGPGGVAFCYLFLKSRFVPRALAVWGILTYASMFVLGTARLLLPGLPAAITNVLYGQGAAFEVFLGLWLLVMAVDTSRSGLVQERLS